MSHLLKRNYFLFFFLILISINPISAQQIRINEAVSSNRTFSDEDGDTPDWFELHNVTSDAVSLENWTVTDDINEPDKWTFPDVALDSDTYLRIWASDKNRAELTTVRTLINQGETYRYRVPTQEIGAGWKSLSFNDSAWEEGASGFGYADGDDETILPVGTLSVFLRKKFNIADPTAIQNLILGMDFDDGFVAYLNGVEVARENINGQPPAFNAGTPTDHEAEIYQGLGVNKYILTTGELLTGENILCIQVHNISANSSDFTAIPFLSARYNTVTTEGIPPPLILNFFDSAFHTNFKISSGGETLYLFDNNGELVDNLLIPPGLETYSWGIPSGSDDLLLLEEVTPGTENSTTGFLGINDADVIFSHPGGSVSALSLNLSSDTPDAIIRYTLDATIPNESSPSYLLPLNINQNRVVRARIFRENYIPSLTKSMTYLVNDYHDLPVVSLVTEPDNFFDNDTGIYVLGDTYINDFPFFGANFWEDWERPIHLTFYEEDGSLGIEFDAGVKIFGNYSRGQDQRSLAIFARNQYGIDEINYPFFPELDYENFQSLVLRNAGNDLFRSNMRDATITGLMRGTDLEYQAYRPTAAYLNGEYWGIYGMREKVNEHFLASKYNVDADDVSILEFGGDIVQGDNQSYMDVIDFVTNNSLGSNNNYQFVADRIDIENYIIYNVAQIYFDNQDWPGNNIKFWRTPDTKWRWILYDTDFGFSIWNNNSYSNNTLAFALEPNGPGWPNPPYSTLLLRKLTENISFRNELVNRFADEMNTRFLPTNVIDHIDSTAAKIASEIPDHFNRYDEPPAFWYSQVDVMRNFGNQRPMRVKNHIKSVFDLPDYHELTIDNEDPTEGYVLINNRLNIEDEEWKGDYFEDVPIKIRAIAKAGHIFSHWAGAVSSLEEELEFDLKDNILVIPVFDKVINTDNVVINEINYSSLANNNTEDWIEFHNPTNAAVDISGFILKDNDDDNQFIFPENTVLDTSEYLILTKDKALFQAIYPEIENVIGDFDFGLSSTGDAIRLFTPTLELRDEVYYLPEAPWSVAANGQGSTLELISPELDNLLAENWDSVHEFGSPGATNIKPLPPISPAPTFNGEIIEDFKYFPNPFSDEVNITFTLTKATSVKAVLYDDKGAFIRTIFNETLEPDWYEFGDDLRYLSRGVYLLEFTEGESEPVVMKWVKM
ncbi:MAG: hypothetical protein ACI85O_000702 [Saprospiraceae bacterium]|jgi:hypothetical protein